MGLLDKLFDQGSKILKQAVEEALDQKQAQSVVENVSFSDGSRGRSVADAGGGSFHQHYEWDGRSFDDKLRELILKEGGYQLRAKISPDELEEAAGRQIYTRGGGRCLPEDISYGVFRDGKALLYIRLWHYYGDFDRSANREIRRYCELNGVRLLDFFDYMPNAEGYMRERILGQLEAA